MLTPYISKSTLIGIELGGGPIRSNTPTYNPLALSKYGPYAENNVHERYVCTPLYMVPYLEPRVEKNALVYVPIRGQLRPGVC